MPSTFFYFPTIATTSVVPNTPPRLPQVFPEYDPPLYFVTFNVRHRARLLADDRVHAAFVRFARTGGQHGIFVGRYVVMPDHVHLFVRLRPDVVLGQWIRLLKRSLSVQIQRPSPHWQAGFFDHLIRHSESYAAKWDYVRNNPVRAGLVSCAEDWPFQGEIVPLEAE